MVNQNMRELKKEALLKEMPEMFYNLKVNYNFYWSLFVSRISRDILEVVKAKQDKNKHKIVVYLRDKRVFVVVYKKKGPDIYYCNEYRNDKNDNRIKYFVRKLRRAYRKAEDDYAETLYTTQMADTRAI